MVTVLYEQSQSNCATARAAGEDLWIGARELETVTGWSMKPQGLCRGRYLRARAGGPSSGLCRW
jgi:hypothetical protein